MATSERQPVFFYDLTSPECYLAAERIMAALPVVPEWEPVVGRELGNPDTMRADPEPADGQERTARRASELGLQPLRWPELWPPDPYPAALTATYAKRAGRVVVFSLAAFRQAFAGGRDLGQESTILIAAAAAEMHPTAILKGIELRSTRQALAHAVQRAREAGVGQLPAVALDGTLYEGEGQIEAAAAVLSEGRNQRAE